MKRTLSAEEKRIPKRGEEDGQAIGEQKLASIKEAHSKKLPSNFPKRCV